uniref:Ycf46 n=1 Tax=Haramonas pauciplastida TaxID=478668 RepID=UPI002113F12A|nr:Ycf46 [Haramonas pauciplastida]YP_010444179.1 Ycf46 [Haramonas pauciplastida]UTE95033.1 Ycf46 [Haramonas pauciplastida]UTE95065.1 Ycf46 [Haramonas pauciplastida]
MTFFRQLSTLIGAGYPTILIHTYEEDRFEFLIRYYNNKHLNATIYIWDFETGYNINPNKRNWSRQNPLKALEFIDLYKNSNSTFFILKDFHKFLRDVSVSRKLRNLCRNLKIQRKTIIIITPEVNIPLELQDLITILEFKLPQLEEIKTELVQVFQTFQEYSGNESSFFQQNLDINFVDSLAQASQGLSIDRIRRVFARAIIINKQISSKTLELILEEKKQFIKQTEILEFWTTTQNLDSVGGLSILKEWLRNRSNSFSEQAANYGLPQPRGLLLVGFQGTGKSLVAKSIANEWGLPLLRLDIGRLFGSLVGESESRLREMINILENLSPCVLWIDELDKVFKFSSGDGGTTNRVLSTFLTWLAEKEAPVFVVATANNIETLPLEVIRKGRFDEIFFISLPTSEEREQIFTVHLSSLRPDYYRNYDIRMLVNETKDFSGAEIRQSIIEGMYLAFQKKRDFTTNDILEAIKHIVPLARINPKKIKNLYAWALSGRIRLASYFK